MANPPDLDQAQALTDKATPGPWEWSSGMDSRCSVGPKDDLFVKVDGHTDAAFIAAARSLVPALILELRQAKEALTTAQRDALIEAAGEAEQALGPLVGGDLRWFTNSPPGPDAWGTVERQEWSHGAQFVLSRLRASAIGNQP